MAAAGKKRKRSSATGDKTKPSNSGPSKFTAERVRAFLSTLADTAQVGKAAETIGITRMCAYNWRNRHDAFKKAWDEALAVGISRLEDEGVKRGVDGWLEPVFYQGEEVGYVRKFSDTLLTFMLSAHKPERYGKNRTELSGPDGAPLIPDKVEVVLVPGTAPSTKKAKR